MPSSPGPVDVPWAELLPWLPLISALCAAALALAGAIIAAIINHRLQIKREENKIEQERAENVCFRISELLHSCQRISIDVGTFTSKEEAHAFGVKMVTGEEASSIAKKRNDLITLIEIYYEDNYSAAHEFMLAINKFYDAVMEHVSVVMKEYDNEGSSKSRFKTENVKKQLKEVHDRSYDLKLAIIKIMRGELQ